MKSVLKYFEWFCALIFHIIRNLPQRPISVHQLPYRRTVQRSGEEDVSLPGATCWLWPPPSALPRIMCFRKSPGKKRPIPQPATERDFLGGVVGGRCYNGRRSWLKTGDYDRQQRLRGWSSVLSGVRPHAQWCDLRTIALHQPVCFFIAPFVICLLIRERKTAASKLGCTSIVFGW